MPDTKSSTQASTRLSGLKTALLDERRVLALDSHVERVRAEMLLGESFLASSPIVMVTREQVLQ